MEQLVERTSSRRKGNGGKNTNDKTKRQILEFNKLCDNENKYKYQRKKLISQKKHLTDAYVYSNTYVYLNKKINKIERLIWKN